MSMVSRFGRAGIGPGALAAVAALVGVLGTATPAAAHDWDRDGYRRHHHHHDYRPYYYSRPPAYYYVPPPVVVYPPPPPVVYYPPPPRYYPPPPGVSFYFNLR